MKDKPIEDTVVKRYTGITTTLLTEPHDDLTIEQILSHLMHVDPKDITLKFVFDHVRNYIICGALTLTGVKTLSLKVSSFLEGLVHIIGGGTLILTAILLFSLNYLHGITAFSKIIHLTKMSKIWYAIATLLLLMGAGTLLLQRGT